MQQCLSLLDFKQHRNGCAKNLPYPASLEIVTYEQLKALTLLSYNYTQALINVAMGLVNYLINGSLYCSILFSNTLNWKLLNILKPRDLGA